MYGYTIIKKFETEKSYRCHSLIRLVQWALDCIVLYREKVVYAAICTDSAVLWASRNYKIKRSREFAMAAAQLVSGVKNEPTWRSLPPHAADEKAHRKS